jgi:hypothetical protein
LSYATLGSPQLVGSWTDDEFAAMVESMSGFAMIRILKQTAFITVLLSSRL